MSESCCTASPVVSVVMPTYNGARFLRPAIASILEQTFRDFELIVINDGSTDETARILADYHDDHIVVIANNQNLGIAEATNRGLAAARGEYVALQDHDDISLPNRLKVQAEFLRSHPTVALVGSAAKLIDENGAEHGHYREPEDDIDLKWETLFRCPFRHTTVMVRRQTVVDVGGYSGAQEYATATDYDLLSRITLNNDVRNLSESLVLWRRHAAATSIRYGELQDGSRDAISTRNLTALFQRYTDTRAESQLGWSSQDHRRLRAFFLMPSGQLPAMSPEEVIAGLRLLSNIQSIFYRAYSFPVSALARHRMRTAWKCGKHAIALAAHAPWNWRSRMRMSMAGVGCLLGTFRKHA